MNKKTKLFFLSLLALLLLSYFMPFIHALPAGPIVNYVSNSTAAAVSSNRSVDTKGTITVLTMDLNQQDYKWKAYVGNITGKLALDDGTSKSIYDWAMGTPTGEVYVTRSSSVSWANISCVNQSAIDSEQSSLGMGSTALDNINSTFNINTHKTFIVGTKTIANSTCKSIATYINDTAQTINETAYFQEILLKDDTTSSLIFATVMEDNHASYDGANTYDFQMIVPENESASVPLTYFFYVELG